MKFDGRYIQADRLQKLSSDETAQWLCEVGFRDYTAKFLEGDIDGRKLLNLQNYEVKRFILDNNKQREFWNLIQSVAGNRHNSAQETAQSWNMFGQRTGRNPPPRPPGGFSSHSSRFQHPQPTYPSGRQQPTGNHRMPFPVTQYEDDDDSFSDDDQVYIDDEVENYPASVPKNNHPFRKSWGNPDWGPSTTSPKDRYPPSPNPSMPDLPPGRGNPRNVPNYTKWDPKLKQGGRNVTGPVGTPGIRLPPQRPPMAPPDEGPAQDDYLSFEDTNTPGYPPAPMVPRSHPHNRPMHEPPPPIPSRAPFPGFEEPTHSPKHQGFDIPQRPPPPPPSLVSPTGPNWSLPINPHRRDSGRDSQGNSPCSSRGPSLKGNSHVPSRDNSTGSDSSIDSGRPKAPVTNNQFAPFKNKTPNFPTFPPNKQSRPSIASPMPSFKQDRDVKQKKSYIPSLPHKSNEVVRKHMIDSKDEEMESEAYDDVGNGLEDQSWFRDVDRKQAEKELIHCKEPGIFLVRPRASSKAQPYALTLWANQKYYNFIIRKREDGEYALGKSKHGERTFSTALKLIEYYMDHDLILAEGEGSVQLVGPPN